MLWKAGALALFLLTLALPLTLRRLAAEPGSALGLVAGLLATAALCAALGSLSGGGKLWTALHVTLWYGAVNRAPLTDFTGGLLAPGTPSGVALGWLAAGALGLALAALAQARRAAA